MSNQGANHSWNQGANHMKVRSRALALVAAVAAPLAASMSQLALASGGHTLFIRSAVESADGTVTLPLYRGPSRGRTVYYVMLDASDGNFAQQFGLNTSQKLANAAGSAGVQRISLVDGVVDFPATVDFSPLRQITPGPEGFPPASAQPGAVGETGYSPLIQMPDGTIVNAPHLVNNTGSADKVVSVDLINRRVIYREADGFQGGDPIKYLSTEASNPVAATLENATFAPALNALPTLDDDSTASSRAPLAGFINGQTG